MSEEGFQLDPWPNASGIGAVRDFGVQSLRAFGFGFLSVSLDEKAFHPVLACGEGSDEHRTHKHR